MAITAEDFQAVLSTLAQLLPMQRQLDAAALVMAWDTWPRAAKAQVTAAMLQFAAGQRHMDPAPPRDLALHMALLRYLFPLENDRAMVDRGLRADLENRMQEPDRFHDPAPARQEQAPPPKRRRLQGRGGWWHPSQMTPVERQQHLRRVEARLEALLAQGPDGVVRSGAQLLQGLAWYRRALEGFWLLEVDDGGIAAAWIRNNPADARKMLQDAMADTGPALPAPDAVVAGFASGVEVVGW